MKKKFFPPVCEGGESVAEVPRELHVPDLKAKNI